MTVKELVPLIDSSVFAVRILKSSFVCVSYYKEIWSTDYDSFLSEYGDYKVNSIRIENSLVVVKIEKIGELRV